MIRYPSRPTEGRQAFEVSVALPQLALHACFSAGGPEEAVAFIGKKENEHWRAGVKPHFMAHQGRTCGFCERKITDAGDVEHYRPKSAIFVLHPERHGVELESLNNVRGRVFLKHPQRGCHPSGYWWLAYAWDNYLVACGICNQRWKNALFPIEGGHDRAPERGDENTERPLLLDPYGPEDPVDHLAFHEFGVEGLSDIGRATIDTLGLNRPSLTSSRLEKARQTVVTLKKIELALDNGASGDRVAELCRDLQTAGTFGNAHAGMVRCMAVQTLGLPWSDVEALASRHAGND